MEKKEVSEENSLAKKLADRQAMGGKHTSEKANLAAALKLSYIMLGLMAVLNLFYTFALLNVYKNRDVTIHVPPVALSDLELNFGASRVSRTVYEVHADYIIRLLGNVNYDNAEEVFGRIEKYCDEDKIHSIKKAFAYQTGHMKSNLVSQTFKLHKLELEQQRSGMVVARGTGSVTRYIGDKPKYVDLPYEFKLYLKAYRGNVIIVGIRSSINHETGDARADKKVDEYEKDNKYINF